MKYNFQESNKKRLNNLNDNELIKIKKWKYKNYNSNMIIYDLIFLSVGIYILGYSLRSTIIGFIFIIISSYSLGMELKRNNELNH